MIHRRKKTKFKSLIYLFSVESIIPDFIIVNIKMEIYPIRQLEILRKNFS